MEKLKKCKSYKLVAKCAQRGNIFLKKCQSFPKMTEKIKPELRLGLSEGYGADGSLEAPNWNTAGMQFQGEATFKNSKTL